MRSGGEGSGDGPAYRIPVGPPPDVPPGLAVRTTALGRLLVTVDGSYSVYYSDSDGRDPGPGRGHPIPVIPCFFCELVACNRSVLCDTKYTTARRLR